MSTKSGEAHTPDAGDRGSGSAALFLKRTRLVDWVLVGSALSDSLPRVLNVQEAKTHFPRLIDAAHAGETILVATSGKPLARLVPLEPLVQKSRPGAALPVRAGGPLRLSPAAHAAIAEPAKRLSDASSQPLSIAFWPPRRNSAISHPGEPRSRSADLSLPLAPLTPKPLVQDCLQMHRPTRRRCASSSAGNSWRSTRSTRQGSRRSSMAAIRRRRAE